MAKNSVKRGYFSKVSTGEIPVFIGPVPALCLFHYGQALFRKFVDLDLKSAFQKDESLRVWFRSFAVLALLPQKDIDATEYLYSTKPILYEKQIDLFLNYHNEVYGSNSSFPPTMYNHYRNINPRTINYFAGNHNRWKKRSSKAHNVIYTCVDLLKYEQLLAADKRQRNEAGAAPPKRRKKTVLPKNLYADYGIN